MLTLRRVTQGFAFALCAGALAAHILTDCRLVLWMPRMSPLVAIATRIAGRGWVASFWPALLFVALGLLLPRFFCGWVCPLGTAMDLAGRCGFPTSACGPDRGRPLLPVLLLILLLGMAFTTFTATTWFDPLAVATAAVSPASVPERDALRRILTAEQGDFWGRRQVETQLAHFAVMVCLLAVGLTTRAPRAWCRKVCPLGSLYGALGRHALFPPRQWLRRYGHAPACPMSAILTDGSLQRPQWCISCGRCRHTRPKRLRPSSARQASQPIP